MVPRIDPSVKEFGVGITIFKDDHSSTLLFACPLKHRQANHPPLESRTEVTFLSAKLPAILSCVKVEDDQESGMEMNLRLREQPPTPFGEADTGLLKFVM